MKNFIGSLTRFWWAPLVTGLISIGLGVWCLCSPVTSVPVLAYIFAAFICLAGVFNVVHALMNRGISHHWGWALALGLLDLVCGIWLLTLPEEELAVTFVIVLGIWLVCITINAICETFVLGSGSVWWTIFAIILLAVTIWFAFLLLSSPVSMALAGWIYLGISLIAFGVFRLTVAGRIKQLNNFANK